MKVEMKKYWKWLVLILVVIIAIVGVIFYRRDSNGKPFKARLNHSKVMMTPNWYAKVRLSANDGATYEVKNNKDKVIQGKTKTKDGKADIKLNNTGNYIVIAKSDNGHVSKKLPVKVTNYKANINKWTSSVGPLKFKINSVEYKEMTRTNEEPTYRGEIYKKLNKKFYRVNVNYTVKNTGKKSVSALTTYWRPITDSGQIIPVDEGEATPNGYAIDSIRTGTADIDPGTTMNGTVEINSNSKFQVEHLKFRVSEMFSSTGDEVHSGGTAKLE